MNEGKSTPINVKVTGKELRAGYSRTADYSAKTQDLARTRETVHAERSALQAEREQMQAGLVQVEAHLASQAPTRPDVSLFDTDPNEFAYQSEMFRRHQEQSASIAAARIDVTRRIAAERDTSYAEGLRREGATLLEKVPEWKDPARAAKDQAAITAYGMSVGFSAAEMNQVDNHRIAVVLLDGMRWRKHLNDQKPLVAVPLKAVTPTLKPGGAVVEGKATRSQQAYERAASTGRVSDAADAILRAGLL